MTEQPMPFEHEPDVALGNALRTALTPAGHTAFVARVVAALPGARAGSWEVLAAWAGRGIAVAAVALIAGFAVGRTLKPGTSFDEAILQASADSGVAATALVTGAHPPDASIIMVRP
jgi:hypothetical protein